MGPPSGDIRRATDADWPEVVELLRASLGIGDDPRYERFLHWKHKENPFGESPGWVLVDGGDIVGVRLFLRWRFVVDGSEKAEAVRAVDTATAPSHRGQGVFTRLTLAALEDLKPTTDFVFNTPNDQSRPGYLKMGWQEVGHLPARFRARRTPSAWAHVLSARAPAERWSESTDRHHPGPGALDPDARTPPGLATERSAEQLKWRYGFDELCYRVVEHRSAKAAYRLRRRGHAVEAAVCELDVDDARTGVAVVAEIARHTKADYAIWLQRGINPSGLPIPGRGPLLVWRALRWTEMPPLDRWSLTLGDVELF